MKTINKKKFGFTLVELLVVISIIGVLSAILMVNFVGTRERSRDTQRIQDLNSLRNALRLYYNDFQYYPPCTLATSGSCLTSSIGTSGYAPGISGIGYTYITNANGVGFTLSVGLEVGAGDEDVNSQLRCGVSVGNTKPNLYMLCDN